MKKIVSDLFETRKLYHVWRGMISRCHKEYDSHYCRYGGRGIIVCDEWRYNYKEFESFAISNGYKESPYGVMNHGSTIDRIDNDGNYEPGNVRFVTMLENNHNTKTTMKKHLSGKRQAAKYQHLGSEACMKKVRRLDTGEIYESASGASRSVNRSVSSVGMSCRNGTRCAGTRWEYVNE